MGKAKIDKLTLKQEKFAQNIFAGMSQRQAYIKAGYSTNMLPDTMDRSAFALTENHKVSARIEELRKKAEDSTVMGVIERKQRLTEIARARITDYQETGLDSGYINIGKESPNTGAIAGIESATKFDENGNTGTLFTKVKLHDPVRAIQELNKMDGVYKENETNIYNDNRKVEIYGLTDAELERIAAGSRTRAIETPESKA
jgi:phage terminase small subunit